MAALVTSRLVAPANKYPPSAVYFKLLHLHHAKRRNDEHFESLLMDLPARSNEMPEQNQSPPHAR
ncbi:hypothetical protein RA272_30100, partial [Pseudomonas syringae pv. tagetis]|uniref:hypothetical protein n=1 Tax=Pseudomonas syringae group genomosp. 7 TaxID=251699 RepID=UPI00376FE3C3